MDPVTERWPLEWIDEYAARLRAYVHVRERDNLLIKVPNEAHKLNPQGVRILKRVLGGESILAVWRQAGGAPEVRRDLYEFFTGLKQVLQGCGGEHPASPAIEVKPFALGFNTLPVLSEVALTYHCNLACRFCYAGCAPDSRRGAEMTMAEITRVLRIIREEAEAPSVSFTGGEPTLHPGLPALVRLARVELGMRVNLITNATLLDAPLADALAAAGLHSAQVSLEAPDPGIHDALTQFQGSHAKTLRGLALLRDRDIRVHTNTTLNRLNLESAPAMPAFVRALGLERFSMNLIIPAGRGERQSGDLSLSYTELAAWLPRIQDAARSAGVEFMWYSPTPVCLFNPIAYQLGNKGCAACDGLLSVSPAGDVLPCSSWPEPVGNLLREPFDAVWESARACHIRAKACAPAGCDGCADFALCQGACPLYWNHFGVNELEETRHVAACG